MPQDKNVISFSPEKAAQFYAAYNRAQLEGREAFEFEGQTVLVAYAKYVCEYLEIKGFIKRN